VVLRRYASNSERHQDIPMASPLTKWNVE
jgi:hypothetical protein